MHSRLFKQPSESPARFPDASAHTLLLHRIEPLVSTRHPGASRWVRTRRRRREIMKKLVLSVFVLASLYMLRMVIGGDASGYYPSQWLLAFASFFFLSLALVKRAAEVDTMKADLNRRVPASFTRPVST